MLEVAADRVAWDWDMRTAGGRHGGVSGADTVASGFSHVTIRAHSILVDVYGDDMRDLSWTAEEALMNAVRYSPPTMRGCSLGCASVPKCAGWQELGLQVSIDYLLSQPAVYRSAAQLAGALQPYALAFIRVQVGEDNQIVHLTRTAV